MAIDPRAFSAPRALLFFAGAPVGWANNISVQESIGEAPVSKLGDVHRQRFEIVSVDVSGSFDYVHILQEPLSHQTRSSAYGSSFVWPNPAPSGTPGSSSQASDYYVSFPAMDMVMFDKLSSKTIIQVLGVMPQGRGWSVGVGGLMSVNCSFVATRVIEMPGLSDAEANTVV